MSCANSSDVHPTGRSPAFTFVQLSDIHCSTHHDSYNRRVAQAAKEINALQPAFVLLTGDVTDLGKPEEFDKFNEMRALFEVPLHIIAGNHDIGDKISPFTVDHVTEERVAFFQAKAGDLYHSFSHDGCSFIGFDSNILNSGFDIEKEQREWLESRLRCARASKYRFLFTHYPLYLSSPDEEITKAIGYHTVEPPAREDLLDLIEANDVTAVFAGHLHYPLEREYGSSQLTVTGSTAFCVTQDKTLLGYSIARVYDNGVRWTFKRLDEIGDTD
ncbi:MAG: metallophosphoesterase family protein [Armatimonadota bacterium]